MRLPSSSSTSNPISSTSSIIFSFLSLLTISTSDIGEETCNDAIPSLRDVSGLVTVPYVPKIFFGDDGLFIVQSVSRLVGSDRGFDSVFSRVDDVFRPFRRDGIFSFASSLRASGCEALSGGKMIVYGSW